MTGAAARTALSGRLGFWALIPFLVAQGMQVRKKAIRFKPATGPEEGSAGNGSPLHVLAIGDSIIAGVGIPSLAEALPGQFARALAQRSGRQVFWKAMGRNGARAAVVWRRLLPDVPPRAYDAVLLSVGVNDVTSLRRTRRWREDLRGLLQALRVRHPGAAIIVIGLPPLHGFPLLPAPLRFVLGWRARWFDTVLRVEAQRHAGVCHVALDFLPRRADFSPDGFHPGVAACRTLAETLAEAAMPCMATATIPPGTF